MGTLYDWFNPTTYPDTGSLPIHVENYIVPLPAILFKLAMFGYIIEFTIYRRGK